MDVLGYATAGATGTSSEPTNSTLLRDPRTTTWPLAGNPPLIGALLLCYVYLVKVGGPRFMRDRKPYNLRWVILSYNAAMVLLNAYFVVNFLSRSYLGGGYSVLCQGIRFDADPRQGCPLSPILFALYLEPLCRAIVRDASISGLVLSSGSLKLLAYADDVAVVCSSATQVKAVVQHIRNFCNVSGAQMNPEKSAGAWLGGWDTKPERFLGIPWTSKVSSYLGVCLDVEQLSTGRGGVDLNRLKFKAAETIRF